MFDVSSQRTGFIFKDLKFQEFSALEDQYADWKRPVPITH
jgi:hypothetical protein